MIDQNISTQPIADSSKPTNSITIKLSVGIGVFVVVVVMLTVVFTNSRQENTKITSPTEKAEVSASTKTYENDEMKFSIPHAWRAVSAPSDSSFIQAFTLPENTLYFEDEDIRDIRMLVIPLDSQERKEVSHLKWPFSLSVQAQATQGFRISIQSTPAADNSKYAYYTTNPRPILYFRGVPGTEFDQYRVSEQSNFSDTSWKPRPSSDEAFTFSSGDGRKTLYAEFKSTAGEIISTSATFYLDTMPPLGGFGLEKPIVGPDTTTTQIYFGAQDEVSGVAEMRVDTNPEFSTSTWQPYTEQKSFTYNSRERAQDGYFYVQFRDNVGNTSETYSNPYLVDTEPPILYVEVPGESDEITRTVNIKTYDTLSYADEIQMTNNWNFTGYVKTYPLVSPLDDGSYEFPWTFNENKVVWVRVKDEGGNWSEPVPAYAEPKTKASVTPTLPQGYSVPESSADVRNDIEAKIALQSALTPIAPRARKAVTEKSIVGSNLGDTFQIESNGTQIQFRSVLIEFSEKKFLIIAPIDTENISQVVDSFEIQ